MNPKINKMGWIDYGTTATQWAAIIGGISWALSVAFGFTTGAVWPGVALAVSGLAGGKNGSLIEDMFRKVTSEMTQKIIMFLSFVIVISGCSGIHPMFKGAALQSVMSVASPYVLKDCQSIELYAGYRFDWEDVDSNGDPDFTHGFGGIVGGCGQYAKVSCIVVDDCANYQICDEAVSCQVIEVLKKSYNP